MQDATLEHFRALADALAGAEPRNWEWCGPHMSQRMFGITQARAEEYAKRHGGTAREMPPAPTLRDAANAQRAEYERTGRVTVTGFEIEGR